jgi:hypothetical protein
MPHAAKSPRVVTLLLLVIALVSTPLFAQIDKGIIEVIVTDTAGDVLPGVTVTLARPDTGLSITETTGATGVARFAGLNPASYTVSTDLSGFAAVELRDVVLRVGQTRRLTVALQPEAREAITVTAGASVVDVFRQDASTNIVPEQIEMLPVADRDFQRLAFIAPGVQRERGGYRFVTGGPVIGSAGNASEATILVDGVDFTDQALGLARARFSQDAIREFRVINNRFDAEIGGSAGGALSIVTKTGTNDLSGSVFGFYRADELRSAGALETDDLPFSRSQIGFTLGGALVQDRTHFFLSGEFIDEENITLFRPGGSFASQAADVEKPFEQTLGYLGLNHQISDRQSLSAKAVYEKFRMENFRVGGIVDVAHGQQLNRDNYNFTGEHGWMLSGNRLNEFRFQFGSRKYDEPANSRAVAEWFSGGVTLQTGMNILGDLLGEGDMWEIREVFHTPVGARHNVKAGFSVQRVDERSRMDIYQSGLFIWATDTRAFPIAYAYGTGSSDVKAETTIYGAFITDEWRPTSRLTINAGIRYDLDTDGNNPDFRHPLVPEGRDVDTDNFQPRVSFSYDVSGDGGYVVRGGGGIFTGRYLLIPAFTELQQNGITGRILQTRVNGLLYGLPAFALDPNNPTTTGIPLKADITLLADDLEAPESRQVSLGMTTRLGRTGLYFDTELLYIKGENEIIVRDVNFNGNSNPTRPIAAWNQINTYTNEGRSEYKALILSLNGTLRGGHLVTTSVTVGDKKNINDDFSPELPFGYPSDPANIDNEYGYARSHERYRVVLSGVFRLPWDMTVAPIYEYGSGQPWTQRLGYDFNGDGKNSDRAPGVERHGEEGPGYSNLSLRLTKALPLSGFGRMDLIAEAFNVLDETNYDVSSIDGSRYLGGPTLANPAAAYVANPNYGKYRATLPGREIQLGLRFTY